MITKCFPFRKSFFLPAAFCFALAGLSFMSSAQTTTPPKPAPKPAVKLPPPKPAVKPPTTATAPTPTSTVKPAAATTAAPTSTLKPAATTTAHTATPMQPSGNRAASTTSTTTTTTTTTTSTTQTTGHGWQPHNDAQNEHHGTWGPASGQQQTGQQNTAVSGNQNVHHGAWGPEHHEDCQTQPCASRAAWQAGAPSAVNASAPAGTVMPATTTTAPAAAPSSWTNWIPSGNSGGGSSQGMQGQGAPVAQGFASPSAPNISNLTQGAGTIPGGNWTLTAYNCFRAGDRVFCDCDLASKANATANEGIFYTVNLVANGGGITPRKATYYVADDGSLMNTAYVTPTQPVRMVLEYDNVPADASKISLVNGQSNVSNIPVGDMDPNQPSGVMPKRSGYQDQPQQDRHEGHHDRVGQVSDGVNNATTGVNNATTTASSAASTATDTASNGVAAVNNASSTVNNTVSNAKKQWGSLKQSLGH